MPALGDLPAGGHGTVTALAGDPALVQRLYELGLFEGERVEVVGFAPLGDPVEVRIGSTRLSLRRREAAAVTVTAD
jgi:ferrous iron transport protein A